MQRCFHIMNQLAKNFDVTAIIHQDKEDFLKSTAKFPAISSIKLYSTKDENYKGFFSALPSKIGKALRYRWIKRTLSGPADGNLLQYYSILKMVLNNRKFDLIILETLSSINSVSIIKRYDKEVRIFYNAYNVDTNLAKAAVARGDKGIKHLNGIAKVESSFYKLLDGVIACSEDDKTEFIRINKGQIAITVVPNGVTIPEKIYNSAASNEKPNYILFCGSLWSVPNAEGMHWFCKNIWALVLNKFPELKLLVVGPGEIDLKYSEIKSTENLELIGFVDKLEPWYNKSAISIVPLLTGSGTRLKVLEAMGLGVPVISTSIGAEGIKYTDGVNIEIANEAEEFANKIIFLLNDKSERIKISKAARELAESTYDWNIIGNNMADFFKNYLNSKLN